jgi:hypothetical protein
MKGSRAVLAAVVVVVLVVVGWWLFKRTSGAEPIDLLSSDRWASAKKQPAEDLFSLTDATVNGDTRHVIAVKEGSGSRLTWKVRVPEDGWLDLAVALQPDTWTKEGNGVLFRAGVSDGRAYEDLFTLHLNPFANAGDRKWVPVMVDLSAYAGEDVDVILNTNSGPKGAPDDPRNDLPLWAAPRIVVR